MNTTKKLQKDDIISILKKALKEVSPENLIYKNFKLKDDFLIISNKKFYLKNYKNIFLSGAGKAAYSMAKGILNILKDKITDGLIITNSEYEDIGNVKILKGNHPLPDKDTINSSEKLINFLKKINREDLLIFVLSGGASAMLEMLPDDVSLEDYKTFTKIIIDTGMTIYEINTLRKKISLIKGGKLCNFIKGDVICIVLSDVVGDDLSIIGSGPFFCNDSKLFSIDRIIEMYSLKNKLPSKILKNLLKEEEKLIKKNVPHLIIGNNLTLLKTVKNILYKNYQIDAEILTPFIKGEAKEVAKVIIAIAKYRKKYFIFGGETTVTVKGNGRGGRNQEMVLSALIELQNEKDFIFASIGSDGIDGITDAAGAIINKNSLKKMKDLNLIPEEFLKNNDSYNFFKKIGDLIITGKTGNNLLDAGIVGFF